MYKYQSKYKGGAWPPVAPGEARGHWRAIKPPGLGPNDDIAKDGDYNASSGALESTKLAAPKLMKLVIVDSEVCSQFDYAEKDSWKVFDSGNLFRFITLTAATFLSLVSKIKPHLPVGRTARIIYACMSTPSPTSDPGLHPNLLVPISDDATLQGYLSSAPPLLPWMVVVLRRPPPADEDAPRPETPGPVYPELDDDLFLDDADCTVYPHSDSDDDSIPRRFTPPRTDKGFLKVTRKISRSLSRQIALSKRLQESASKKSLEKNLCFPHEQCFRQNMSLEHHKQLKRKYVRFGRDETLTDRFSRWRSDHPIEGVDVDVEGNRLDEDGNIIPNREEDGGRLRGGGNSSESDSDNNDNNGDSKTAATTMMPAGTPSKTSVKTERSG